MQEIIIISAILMVVAIILGALMGAIIACIANRNSVEDAYKMGYKDGAGYMYKGTVEIIEAEVSQE